MTDPEWVQILAALNLDNIIIACPKLHIRKHVSESILQHRPFLKNFFIPLFQNILPYAKAKWAAVDKSLRTHIELKNLVSDTKFELILAGSTVRRSQFGRLSMWSYGAAKFIAVLAVCGATCHRETLKRATSKPIVELEQRCPNFRAEYARVAAIVCDADCGAAHPRFDLPLVRSEFNFFTDLRFPFC